MYLLTQMNVIFLTPKYNMIVAIFLLFLSQARFSFRLIPRSPTLRKK